MEVETLYLDEIATGSAPAITSSRGDHLAEAAGVCLESQGHRSGVVLQVRGEVADRFALRWTSIGARAQLVYADHQETTEDGATCIAILVARATIALEVVARSAKGTGFDYWLGIPSDGANQPQARLMQ